MDTWEITILKIVKSRGGHANTQEIYNDLESGDFKILNDEHLRKTSHGGRKAYQNQVRSHLSNLSQASDLKWVKRGTYEITDKGLKRIEG